MKNSGKILATAALACSVLLLTAAGSRLASGAADNGGHSLVFNGVNYVQLPHSSEIIGREPEAVSVSLWFKLLDLSEITRLAGGYNGMPFTLSVSHGGSRAGTRIRGTDLDHVSLRESIRTRGLDIAANEWHHICFTYNYEKGEGRLYLDGRKIAANDNMNSVSPLNRPIRLGREQNYESMKHQLAEVRIYTRALEKAEAKKLSSNEPIAETNLAGHWKIDEGEGAVARDKSGNKHHGTLGPEDDKPIWSGASPFGP